MLLLVHGHWVLVLLVIWVCDYYDLSGVVLALCIPYPIAQSNFKLVKTLKTPIVDLFWWGRIKFITNQKYCNSAIRRLMGHSLLLWNIVGLWMPDTRLGHENISINNFNILEKVKKRKKKIAIAFRKLITSLVNAGMPINKRQGKNARKTILYCFK